MYHLTNNKETLLGEFVVRNLKVERSGALPDSAAGVVMTAVAGAVVTTKLSGVGDGDAAEVGAHAEDHQPLGVLDTLGVRLGVPQGGGVTRHLGLNLRGGPVSDEQGLASPLEGHVLTLGDVPQLDLDLGEGQHVLGRGPRADELIDKGLAAIGSAHA